MLVSQLGFADRARSRAVRAPLWAFWHPNSERMVLIVSGIREGSLAKTEQKLGLYLFKENLADLVCSFSVASKIETAILAFTVSYPRRNLLRSWFHGNVVLHFLNPLQRYTARFVVSGLRSACDSEQITLLIEWAMTRTPRPVIRSPGEIMHSRQRGLEQHEECCFGL